MQSNRRVYILSSDAANINMAARVASSLSPGQPANADLMKKSALSELSFDDLKQLIYVGRYASDRHDHTGAKDFVKRFLAQFDKKSIKLARRAVEHIYLFDSYSSHNSKQNRLFAQHVVNLLHESGFKRVVTHAIAFPAGSKKGDKLETHLCQQADGGVHSLLVSSLTVKSQKFMFISDVDPITELNKAQHTFIASETKTERKFRLAAVLHSKQQQRVISKIVEKYKSILASREGDKKIRKNCARRLKIIAEQLKLADTVEWVGLLKQAKVFFSSSSDSKINYMLDKLYTESQLAVKTIKLHVEPIAHQTEVPVAVAAHPQPVDNPVEPVVPVSAEDQALLSAFKERVLARRNILNAELGKYTSFCLAPFFASKAQTKISKMNELDALYAEATLPAFMAKVTELKANTQVISGTFYKRTAKMLDEMIEEERVVPRRN